MLVLGGLAAWAVIARSLMRNAWSDPRHGVLLFFGRRFLGFMHRPRVEGRAELFCPRPGPLIVVSNHTAGIDPMLIQVFARFPIYWMMAQDMRAPALEWFWQLYGVVFVDRRRSSSAGFREAVERLRAGGIVGIFPEGGLERPARTIRPFHPGVGTLVKRSGAPVLPLIVRGTPEVDPAWASLWHRSRSVIEVREILEYRDSGMDAGEITADLRRRYLLWTGWPETPEPGPGGMENQGASERAASR